MHSEFLVSFDLNSFRSMAHSRPGVIPARTPTLVAGSPSPMATRPVPICPSALFLGSPFRLQDAMDNVRNFFDFCSFYLSLFVKYSGLS